MGERFEVRAGRARLACERFGDAATRGPTLVLLHAGVSDRRSWRDVAEALAADGGARAITYDRRGFGETMTVPQRHSEVEDLAAVLDALVGDAPVWLVGSSQGGRIAVDFALAAPGRVAGMVLVAPAISGWPEPPIEDLDEREQRLADLAEAAEEAGDPDALNRYDTWFWLDGPREREGRVGGAVRDLALEMNRRILTADDAGEALEPPSAVERLGELDVPALVAWGDLDWTAGRDLCTALADRLPDAEPLVLENTAHLPHLERPAEFAGHLRAFLARHAAP